MPIPCQQRFSERELQIIELLLKGKSTRLIASQFGVSTRAVEIHLTHIYEKLEVDSRVKAIIKLIHLFEK